MGDLRVSLSALYPCIWFDGVNLEKSYDEQRDAIMREVKASAHKGQAKYVAPSMQSAGGDDQLQAYDEDDDEEEDGGQVATIQADVKRLDQVDSSAMPQELAPYVSEAVSLQE